MRISKGATTDVIVTSGDFNLAEWGGTDASTMLNGTSVNNHLISLGTNIASVINGADRCLKVRQVDSLPTELFDRDEASQEGYAYHYGTSNIPTNRQFFTLVNPDESGVLVLLDQITVTLASSGYITLNVGATLVSPSAMPSGTNKNLGDVGAPVALLDTVDTGTPSGQGIGGYRLRANEPFVIKPKYPWLLPEDTTLSVLTGSSGVECATLFEWREYATS